MTIYISGDSTAASYGLQQAPFTGWGQVLNEYLPLLSIVNAAYPGRSAKSFIAEGRLVNIEKTLAPGDLLLIQFAHNDASQYVWRHTEPFVSYKNCLEIFILTARAHGAVPVLITPIPIRTFKNGVLEESHVSYRAAALALSKEAGVPLLDMYTQAYKQISELGDEKSRELYMNLKPGEYPNFPEGKVDDVHTQRAGACLFAQIAASGLKKLGLVK